MAKNTLDYRNTGILATTQMKIKTSKSEMQRHSFFADLISGTINGTESFVPWLVKRVGEDWSNPNIRINFHLVHISKEILSVWQREAKKNTKIPPLDKVPGIQVMKKDQHGFEIYLEHGAVFIA